MTTKDKQGMNERGFKRFATDERGVSFQVGYLLSILIATILVASLTATVPGQITDAQQTVADYELSVVGERVATQMEAVDNIVSSIQTAEGTTDDTHIEIDANTPDAVTGDRYVVELEETSDTTAIVRLSTIDGSIETEHEIQVQEETDVRTQTLSDGTDNPVEGGEVVIIYDGNELHLDSE